MSSHDLKKVLLAALICAFCGASVAAAQSAGKITGRIVDRSTGQPLAAEVGVAAPIAGKVLFRHTFTNPSGEFLIDGLDAGTVHLTTKLDGYATEHLSVSLGPGEVRTVAFSLVPARLLRGIVRGPDGRPIAGASLKVIYPIDLPARGESQTTYQWETGDTYSDDKGSFTIAVHPDKDFVVEASHRNLVSRVSAPLRIQSAAKEKFLDLALEPGVTVTGEVRDARGNPIQGAQVRLVEIGSRRSSGGFLSHELLRQQLRTSASGTDGAFRFDQVRPTKKRIVILRTGYKPFQQVLDPSATPSPLRVVLEAANQVRTE